MTVCKMSQKIKGRFVDFRGSIKFGGRFKVSFVKYDLWGLLATLSQINLGADSLNLGADSLNLGADLLNWLRCVRGRFVKFRGRFVKFRGRFVKFLGAD